MAGARAWLRSTRLMAQIGKIRDRQLELLGLQVGAGRVRSKALSRSPSLDRPPAGRWGATPALPPAVRQHSGRSDCSQGRRGDWWIRRRTGELGEALASVSTSSQADCRARRRRSLSIHALAARGEICRFPTSPICSPTAVLYA